MFEANGPFPEAGWDGVWVGSDPEYGMPLEVLAGLWTKPGAPTQDALKTAHKKRLDRRAVPLAVFAYDKSGKAWLFGPSTDAGVIELTQSQGQRLLQSALSEPDASSARTLLLRGRDALAEHGDAGVLLQGLFSDQQILRGLPKESGWAAACERGAKVLAGNHQDIDLVRALGFQHKEITGDAYLLSLGGEPPRAVAILLRSAEAFDAAGARFSKSPIYHGLEIARRNNVPWLVVARGSEIRLYPTSPSVGVGRRGATQTYFGLDLALIDESKAGYLDLAFSAKALAPNGSVDQILNDSKTYVAALSSRLRDRVYEDVVSRLSVAVAEKLREAGPLDADRLSLAYRLTLKILFRLLFQAYAEDIRVLPFQRNERYTAASLKQLARHMADEPQQADSPKSTSLFDGLLQVWRVIDHGDPDWGVPAYNGGLFGTDSELHPDGAAIEKLALTNDILGPALRGLLVDVAKDGTLGPVDFRSLDVRDFGTIYEGLLEAGLSIAEDNLADDGKGGWKVAEKGDTALVKKTHPYFHTKSGDRKATGSYFTPSFVVEHLLERSLDPALDTHLARVEELLTKEGDQVGASRKFFDFRIADLAMGSGHFLVAAISHIEQKFGSFLERNPIPGVEKELIDLHTAAKSALGAAGVITEVDRSGLLGRQIAKRCIYGLDVNEIAVDLARLAIWVRTFVPGLPMSSLDHQLVWGNSLTGIGTVQEALDILSSGEEFQTSVGETMRVISYAEAPIRTALESARAALEEAATLKESTSEEVHITQQKMARAIEVARPAHEIMSAALAVKLGLVQAPLLGDLESTLDQASAPTVRDAVARLRPAHFPALFPEVFLREPSGFDVMLGNPPWEEMIVEPRNWWGQYIPGLRTLNPEERDRVIEEYAAKVPALSGAIQQEILVNEATRALVSGPMYAGIGKSNPDLYQAFSWRNWHLMRTNGSAGLVLPRAAFSGSALSAWRKEVISTGKFQQVMFLTNNREWVFSNIHPQITIGLAAFSKGTPGSISILGPFHNLTEFQTGRARNSSIEPEVFLTWSSGAAFPLLGSAEVAELYEKIRAHGRFSETQEYQFVALDEMNGTADRPLFSKPREKQKTIEVWTGASYDIWNPDAGKPYAVGDWDTVTDLLLGRARTSSRKKNSAFIGRTFNSIKDHPLSSCRLSFRRTTNATNTRTTIVCLIPPNVALVNSSPYLVRMRGGAAHEAFVLGVMSSIPFDWQARRVVELGFSAEILNSMAMPLFRADAITERIVEISGSLAAIDARYLEWAAAVGVPIGSLSGVKKDAAVAELDALVALAYGLSVKDLGVIFKSFHRGWDESKSEYVERLEQVLKHYDAWAAKV
jgi:hypothetical protein